MVKSSERLRIKRKTGIKQTKIVIAKSSRKLVK